MAKARSDTVGQRKKEIAQAAFLEAFAECGTIRHAAKAAGIGRQTHYDWLEADPKYADAFAEAEHEACEALEAEARRRAVEGVEQPVFQGGKKIGMIRKYSDTLLIFLLNGANPEKYRQRVWSEISGKNGEPLLLTEDELFSRVSEILIQGSARSGNDALTDRLKESLRERKATK